MRIGICSFSFHRLLAAGKQDIFQYIADCKTLECTQLDPWNAHLAPLKDGDAVLRAGRNPGQSHHLLSDADEQYVDRVAAAARKAGVPFGTIAVDGAHIYEPDEEVRRANRARAYRWLDVAHKLGARQVRIDAGGPEDLPDDVFRIIVDGYRDLIDRGKSMGIEILVENHWGPTRAPDNLIKLLDAVEGLGLLLDMANWSPGKKEEGRRRCARYARATHFKARRWDEHGNELTEDMPAAVQAMLDAGYDGCWGIESVPEDGDEIGAAGKTIALLRRLVAQKRSIIPAHNRPRR